MTYGYKTLKEFKNEYIMEAEQSIIVPKYSANKDFDTKVANLMKEHFKSNPTKMFIKMNEYLRSIVRDDWEVQIINYQQERETYLATLKAVEVLGIKYIPTIYSYKTKNISMILNSCALGYGNNINIFLSYFLFNKVLSDSKEKEFIIGHELGHNQNNSTAVHIVNVSESLETSRFGEYTADRAGLLVCKDVEAATRALLKVSTAGDISKEKCKETAHNIVENAEINLFRLPEDRSTHPCLERRVAAMKTFSISKMYARLTGIPVSSSMLSDEALEQRLARIIKGGK